MLLKVLWAKFVNNYVLGALWVIIFLESCGQSCWEGWHHLWTNPPHQPPGWRQSRWAAPPLLDWRCCRWNHLHPPPACWEETLQSPRIPPRSFPCPSCTRWSWSCFHRCWNNFSFINKSTKATKHRIVNEELL